MLQGDPGTFADGLLNSSWRRREAALVGDRVVVAVADGGESDHAASKRERLVAETAEVSIQGTPNLTKPEAHFVLQMAFPGPAPRVLGDQPSKPFPAVQDASSLPHLGWGHLGLFRIGATDGDSAYETDGAGQGYLLDIDEVSDTTGGERVTEPKLMPSATSPTEAADCHIGGTRPRPSAGHQPVHR